MSKLSLIAQVVDNNFICQCPQGYSGSRCEIATLGCEQEPCVNGGTCELNENTYLCSCVGGWSGFNCEQQIDECMLQDVPCQNGKGLSLIEKPFHCSILCRAVIQHNSRVARWFSG